MRSFASADGARRLSDAATDASHRCASIVPGRRVDSSRFLLVVGRRLDSEQERSDAARATSILAARVGQGCGEQVSGPSGARACRAATSASSRRGL